jgi:hypothetical protein
MLVLHDDAEREFAYTAGAEKAIGLAEQQRVGRGLSRQFLPAFSLVTIDRKSSVTNDWLSAERA